MRTLVIVTGPPASGKTTWIHEHANPGDIVIDFDTIANKLAGTTGWDHAPDVRREAHRKWRLGVASALKSQRNAWIIHSRPSVEDLARYEAAGATIITIDPGEDIVRERCRTMRPAESLEGVERWYATRRTTTRTTNTSREW